MPHFKVYSKVPTIKCFIAEESANRSMEQTKEAQRNVKLCEKEDGGEGNIAPWGKGTISHQMVSLFTKGASEKGVDTYQPLPRGDGELIQKSAVKIPQREHGWAKRHSLCMTAIHSLCKSVTFENRRAGPRLGCRLVVRGDGAALRAGLHPQHQKYMYWT